MIRCAVCGRRIKAVDLVGKWWVYVHAEGGPATADHYATPDRVTR